MPDFSLGDDLRLLVETAQSFAARERIEKLYRDVKVMDIVEGTGQIQRIIMASKLVGLPH